MKAPSICFALLFCGSVHASGLVEVSRPTEMHRFFSPRAKLRVVNIWATWCVPCVREMSDLKAIDEAFDERDAQLIGVSLDDVIPGERARTKARVSSFLSKKMIGYRNFYYTGKLKDLISHYKFEGEIPITIVFDAAGREIFRHQGQIERNSLVKKLNYLLKKHPKKGTSR